MAEKIGIRREDKNIWERRVPLIPAHIKELKEKHQLDFAVQTFSTRAFSDDEFTSAGISITEEIDDCGVIIAVKEIPIDLLLPDKTYLYFSHTIKGQAYNMPMLKKLINLKCTLIDYECIKDDKDRRLVFFGKYAGLAGMIDTLHGMGQRYKYLGLDTPFSRLKPAYEYRDLEEAKAHIAKIGKEILDFELPDELLPLTVGFAGYGNVSQGAQDIFNLLPFLEITPAQLGTIENADKNKLYKVVFKEEDMVEPIDGAAKFKLQEYYKYPEKYKSKFENYLPHLSVLINAIYWTESYPRFVTKDFIKKNIKNLKLQVLGDITCDIDGAVEFTYKATESDNPAYVFNPETGKYTDGYEGKGIVDIAVDNLPTEIPRDSSVAFSDTLSPFIPGIANADYTKSFEDSDLPAEIKRAVILYKGELTPEFKYIQEFLDNYKKNKK